MIKKFLQSLKDTFKVYILNHLATNILLIIISITMIIIDLDDPSKFIQRLIVTLFLTAMCTVLGETYTKDNKKRYIIYIIGLLISIVISKCILNTELVRYLIGIIFLLGGTILFLMANKSKEGTPKYLTSAITNLFKYGIIGFVLNIGILLILGLISALLIEVDEIVFAKMEILLFVLYFIPALIISLENKEEENNFMYVLINYVSLPLVLIATSVIYIFIIKLIITHELPHTATFSINALLLSLGIPIVLMALSYDNNKLPYKIANILRKLFIPLIPLQIFSLYLRIADYSLTTARYFGILLIVVGIASLILININKGEIFKFVLIPCIILSIPTFIIPYINIIELPNYMQINRLKQLLPEGKDFKELTSDEINNIRSIYYMVSDSKYYPEYLSQKDLEELLFNQGNYIDKENNYIYYTNEETRINIENYKEIEKYSFSTYKELKISVNNKEYDLSSFCEEIYNNKEENIDDSISNKQPIQLDNNTYLYITELSLKCDNKYLDVDGYILYK